MGGGLIKSFLLKVIDMKSSLLTQGSSLGDKLFAYNLLILKLCI
jgi:hypothetical protein